MSETKDDRVVTYPLLEGWSLIGHIPEEVAKAWIIEKAPNARIAGHHGVTAKDIFTRASPHSQTNHLAVIVEVFAGNMLAVSYEDGDYLLLRKRAYHYVPYTRKFPALLAPFSTLLRRFYRQSSSV